MIEFLLRQTALFVATVLDLDFSEVLQYIRKRTEMAGPTFTCCWSKMTKSSQPACSRCSKSMG